MKTNATTPPASVKKQAAQKEVKKAPANKDAKK